MTINPKSFFDGAQAELQSINSRLAKLESGEHKTSLPLLEEQKEAIAKLQEMVNEKLKPQLDSAVHRDHSLKPLYGAVDELNSNIDAAIERIENIRVEATQGKGEVSGSEEVKDPGIYKLIDVISSEHGNQYVFQDRALSEEEYEEMIDQVYPAVVPTFKMFLDRYEDFFETEVTISLSDTLEELGYKFDREKREITIPDGQLLNFNRASLVNRYPEPENHPLKTFQVISSGGIAEDLEFIDTILDHKVILSTGVEFTHDQLVHVISEIIMRLEGTYAKQWDTLIALATPIRQLIARADQKLSDLRAESEEKERANTDLKQLATMLSTWLDVNTAGPYVGYESMEALWTAIASGKGQEGKIFLQNFNEAYPDAPLDDETPRIDYLLALTYLATIDLEKSIIDEEDRLELRGALDQMKEQVENTLLIYDIPYEKNSDGSLSLKSEGKNISIREHPVEVMNLLRQKMGL